MQRLAEVCNSLSAEDVWLFFERWQAALPSPLTDEDRRRGYVYDLAFRQLEISDTRIFDKSTFSVSLASPFSGAPRVRHHSRR